MKKGVVDLSMEELMKVQVIMNRLTQQARLARIVDAFRKRRR